jgi:hypothetical protein
MSSVFRTKHLQDTGLDNVFFLEKSCRKMYTIFSAVQRQQRKSDVMTSLCLTACSAVYYQVPHCRFLITGVKPGVVQGVPSLICKKSLKFTI